MHKLHCECGKLLMEAEGDAEIQKICPRCRKRLRFIVRGSQVSVEVMTSKPDNRPKEYK